VAAHADPGGRAARAARFGGPEGNEQLTAVTGVALIAPLAALGVTILRIGQLLDAHMFIGMLLIGPVALKMGSTGYRFVRYYSGSRDYRRKGPPALELRLLAPAVVLLTVVVFATGVVLLFVGPTHRGILVGLHKVSFVGWLAVTALHVLGHLPGLPAALRADRRERPWDDHGSGRGSRVVLLASSLAAGVVLALAVESQFGAWAHFHHGG